MLAIPGSALAVPFVLVLAAINKLLSPHLPALFVQRRVGQVGEIRVLKLRSLPPIGVDPGNTQVRYGQWLRRHYLDELPQVPQVLLGQLSMVGIRVLPLPVYDRLAQAWSPARFTAWQRVYHTTPLGLTGIHQVYRRRGKDDLYRFHRDVFYARRASLGLDLYLVWRTVRCLGRLPG